MQHAHTPRLTPGEAEASRSIHYDVWKLAIHTATELDQLIATVRAYLAQWRPEDLASLPVEVGSPVLRSCEEIPLRAVVAAQADLKARPDEPAALLLREMALTMMAAASRLRFLTSRSALPLRAAPPRPR